MTLARIVSGIGGSHEDGTPNLPLALLCASAFGIAFSLPVGRIFTALALIVILAGAIRGRVRLRFPPAAWIAVAFAALAIVTVLRGPLPDVGIRKLDKLIWFVSIPVAATIAVGEQRVLRLLTAFSAGATIQALDVCLVRPIRAWTLTNSLAAAGKPANYAWELTNLGSMTDGQILGMAVVATTALLILAHRRARLWAAIVLLLQLAALVINQKRGSWFATAAVAGLLVLLKTNWKVILALALAAAATLLVPFVQTRLADMRTELSDAKGGRLVMWTRIAPALHAQYPYGLGFRCLTSELMQETATSAGVHVEPDRNHLHNNMIQITVAMGWAGLLLYLVWVANAIVDGVRWMRSEAATAQGRTVALCCMLMFGLLFLNGLVEYNVADGELLLIYGMLLGALGTNARTSMPETSAA